MHRSLVVNRHAMKVVVYGSRFLQKRPLVAKGLPTAFGFAFGDVLTQYFHKKTDTYTHDFKKTAQMAAVGGVVAAPVGLALYRWMDAVWPGSGFLMAAAKFTLDQVVGCAIWQAAYLAISEPYRQALLKYLDSKHISTSVRRPLALQA